MTKSAEDQECQSCEDAAVGLGKAVFVCIDHLRTSKEATAVMCFQILLDNGDIDTYRITVEVAPPIIQSPVSKTLN